MSDDKVERKTEPYRDGALVNGNANITPDVYLLVNNEGLKDNTAGNTEAHYQCTNLCNSLDFGHRGK